MQKQNYDSYTLDFIVKASYSYLCESWKKNQTWNCNVKR